MMPGNLPRTFLHRKPVAGFRDTRGTAIGNYRLASWEITQTPRLRYETPLTWRATSVKLKATKRWEFTFGYTVADRGRGREKGSRHCRDAGGRRLSLRGAGEERPLQIADGASGKAERLQHAPADPADRTRGHIHHRHRPRLGNAGRRSAGRAIRHADRLQQRRAGSRDHDGT